MASPSVLSEKLGFSAPKYKDGGGLLRLLRRFARRPARRDPDT
jgi:hypothetical protein